MDLEKLSQPYVDENVGMGNTVVQTKTGYATAMQIQKPRNLMQIINRCEIEAAVAGEDFYYSWKQGGEFIEGLSINAAMAIARNYGNCAVDVKLEETSNSYIFTGYFIDLETGFNIARPFRQNKQSPKSKNGTEIYKGERGADIIFQIGASKAIRNVILNAMPPYLTKSVMEKAKNGVLEQFKKMGIEKAIFKILQLAKKIEVEIYDIESTYGSQLSWDIEKVVMIAGALKSVQDGIMKSSDVFSSTKSNTTSTEPKTNTVSDMLKRKTVASEKTPETKKEVEPEINEAEVVYDQQTGEVQENDSKDSEVKEEDTADNEEEKRMMWKKLRSSIKSSGCNDKEFVEYASINSNKDIEFYYKNPIKLTEKIDEFKNQRSGNE